MGQATLIVMYPKPGDMDAFESRYHNEHIPMPVTPANRQVR
ncbi:MAG: hypothetical protein ABJC63_15890 [Gemmatimonadales bacterium]